MVKISTRIRYSETDRMGFVYHSHYLVFLEMGRTEWLRKTGISYKEMEDMGFFLPVVKIDITYKKPAKYDDIIKIYTSLKSINSRSIEFSYTLKRENTILVIATTKHIFMNNKGKAITLDKKLYEKIKRISGNTV